MSDRLRRILSHDSGPFWQFVKYGAIGVMATGVQYLVFYALATTCLKCLTPDDIVVRHLGFAAAEFTGDEPWHAQRWFLAAAAVAVGFVFANVFCWLMNRWFVFRPGKFRWYAEFGMFFGVAAVATAIALGVQSVLIRQLGMMTTLAVAIEVVVSFAFNYFFRKFFIFRG